MAPCRVVIVDDHESARNVMAGLLAADDRFDVVGVAADGVAALGVLRERTPDAVILDVKMPVMDGLEVLEAIRPEQPDLIVVIHSSDQAAQPHAERLGADAYMPKGIAFDEILDRLDELMRSRLSPDA